MAVLERIESLRARHAELERHLHAMQTSPSSEDTELQRLKREKLKIKDEIARLAH